MNLPAHGPAVEVAAAGLTVTNSSKRILGAIRPSHSGPTPVTRKRFLSPSTTIQAVRSEGCPRTRPWIMSLSQNCCLKFQPPWFAILLWPTCRVKSQLLWQINPWFDRSVIPALLFAGHVSAISSGFSSIPQTIRESAATWKLVNVVWAHTRP